VSNTFIEDLWCWLGGHDLFPRQRLYADCACPSIWAQLWDWLRII